MEGQNYIFLLAMNDSYHSQHHFYIVRVILQFMVPIALDAECEMKTNLV